MPVEFDYSICEGCGECDALCPGDVIYMRPRGEADPVNDNLSGTYDHIKKPKVPYLKYTEECWHCGSCRQDCPNEAITVVFPPDMLCM
ncbi:MAG: ferredoxin family protein [Rhodospirillaceae bacterium]|jgi:NAD-dependent dihydropyrimidine dehydrogenase PreA subunit|nr:ferredoxin family protein [Rhodospirillaceae bacterium]MBT4938944.1 ferredoxin family protein [Rhodospirillaceae bacterium]MBT7268220.1 ferredoxin family protein [Rhodospirillaceae bacterium]